MICGAGKIGGLGGVEDEVLGDFAHFVDDGLELAVVGNGLLHFLSLIG